MKETLTFNGDGQKPLWMIMVGRSGVMAGMVQRDGVPTLILHGYRESPGFTARTRRLAKKVFSKPKRVKEFTTKRDDEVVEVVEYQERGGVSGEVGVQGTQHAP